MWPVLPPLVQIPSPHSTSKSLAGHWAWLTACAAYLPWMSPESSQWGSSFKPIALSTVGFPTRKTIFNLPLNESFGYYAFVVRKLFANTGHLLPSLCGSLLFTTENCIQHTPAITLALFILLLLLQPWDLPDVAGQMIGKVVRAFVRLWGSGEMAVFPSIYEAPIVSITAVRKPVIRTQQIQPCFLQSALTNQDVLL